MFRARLFKMVFISSVLCLGLAGCDRVGTRTQAKAAPEVANPSEALTLQGGPQVPCRGQAAA